MVAASAWKLGLVTALAALCGPVFALDPAPGEAAPPATTEPPAPPDIIVRGRALGELRLRIRLAEDAIFTRFNDINSTDDFDIHCRMEPAYGSKIRERRCLSNSWRENDAEYAQAMLTMMRGQGGTPAQFFLGQQLLMQRRLADEVRRLALEDEELQEAVLRLGRARLELAARTGTRSEWTAWREVNADADGLPFEAERMFEVHIGRQPWNHLLTRRTFTIALVSGDIRAIRLYCNDGNETLDYEPDVEWTIPANWSSCILAVRAKKDTTFALYEF